MKWSFVTSLFFLNGKQHIIAPVAWDESSVAFRDKLLVTEMFNLVPREDLRCVRITTYNVHMTHDMSVQMDEGNGPSPKSIIG